MKAKITVKHTETTTVDIGEIPFYLLRDLLQENGGKFNDNWTLSDLPRVEWTVDSVEVEEIHKK